jgi:hypothetical protein
MIGRMAEYEARGKDEEEVLAVLAEAIDFIDARDRKVALSLIDRLRHAPKREAT